MYKKQIFIFFIITVILPIVLAQIIMHECFPVDDPGSVSMMCYAFKNIIAVIAGICASNTLGAMFDGRVVSWVLPDHCKEICIGIVSVISSVSSIISINDYVQAQKLLLNVFDETISEMVELIKLP